MASTSSGSQPNPEFRLIRAWSNHEVETDENVTDIVRAVADHTNREELNEKTRLRKYFNTTELSTDIDIRKLDVEATRLEAALKTFNNASATRNSWGLSSLKTIVKTEKETWENKPRLV